MRTVNMYNIGEEVYIKAEVADVKAVKGELKYIIKDPLTAKCFDYLYTDDQLIPVDAKAPEKNTTKKVTK